MRSAFSSHSGQKRLSNRNTYDQPTFFASMQKTTSHGILNSLTNNEYMEETFHSVGLSDTHDVKPIARS